MEISSAHPLLHSKFPKPLISFPAPPSLPFFQCKASFLASNSVLSQSSKSFLTQSQGVGIKTRQQRSVGAIHASQAESPPKDVSERWLLVPVGQCALPFLVAYKKAKHIQLLYKMRMHEKIAILGKCYRNLIISTFSFALQ